MNNFANLSPDMHFFAASYATWATTNDERDLPALIDFMQREGNTFNLFLVPLHHTAHYKICFYKPEVEGTLYLGTFESKKSKRKAA